MDSRRKLGFFDDLEMDGIALSPLPLNFLNGHYVLQDIYSIIVVDEESE